MEDDEVEYVIIMDVELVGMYVVTKITKLALEICEGADLVPILRRRGDHRDLE